MRPPPAARLGRPARPAAVAALGLLIALLLPVADAQAAGWPSVFHAYGRFDGTTFNDPIDQPAGNAIADLSSGVTSTASGPLPSTYIAADGTDLLVRFRLKTTPGLGAGWDTSKGGLTNNAYVVQLGVNGTHVASVGLDGKTAAADYVYVAPVNDVTAGGTTYTAANPRVVSTWNGTEIPGARLTNAATAGAPAETFLDFRVPLSDITLVAPSITPTTPLQFFYGSSAAANLTTINKDFMSNDGETCALVGCAEVIIGPSRIGLTWTDTPAAVSGPNPPQVGAQSVYDLTVTANNTGLNELSAIEIVDDLPAGVTVLSTTTASGSASMTDQHLLWTPDPLAPGEEASLTIRAVVTPGAGTAGTSLQLSPGPTGTALDVASGTSSSAALTPTSVGPVAGDGTGPVDDPTEAPTEEPTAGPTQAPTEEPTADPTEEPTAGPTDEPTEEPTADPTAEPTADPTEVPTAEPTDEPTAGPTDEPTADPTEEPTADPTEVPTAEPTDEPTAEPTDEPTAEPTASPTDQPTNEPTASPSDEPTAEPSDEPTAGPSDGPTQGPSEPADPNPVPLAVDDAAGGRTGEAVTVDVLANDAAPDSWLETSTVTVLGGMAHGDVLGVDPASGAVTYRPDPGYEGLDGFRYRVCNGHAQCDVADVSTATPPVDLEVTVVRTGAQVRVGQESTYDITVTNLGPRVAEAPLTLTLSTSGLALPHAAGGGWLLTQPATLSATSHLVPSVYGAAQITLMLPVDLPVSQPEVVTLTGVVTGAAGTQVRVDAEVAGPTIELEYANNESSARDTIRAIDPVDPVDPVDPQDPTDPVGPRDPADPVDPRDPTDPRDPADPADPIGPTDTSRPTAPGQATDGEHATADDHARSLAATGSTTVALLVVAVGLLVLGVGVRAATAPSGRR